MHLTDPYDLGDHSGCMAFYVYRHGKKIEIVEGDESTASRLHKQFGEENLGERPYDHRDEAERYQLRCQEKEDANPGCKLPYSAEKD